VPFHGRTVKGWILGPAADVPAGRVLAVRSVRSPVRFFDPQMLALLRWMGERYIAPLASVIERSHPPRVAGEEQAIDRVVDGGLRRARPSPDHGAVRRQPSTTAWVRPLPGHEGIDCVHALEGALARGEQAIVLVPEAEPVPATARAVLEAFGQRACAFMGGDRRGRYRAWLDVQGGRFDVVVATRPGVFAPLDRLGMIWVSREVHPGHREDRSPYYHVREVAMARARLSGGRCVLASLSPSVETAAAIDGGVVSVSRPGRQEERAAAPLVETVAPEAEDRSPRLAALVRRAGSGALIVSRRGYGTARVCRSCGEPAACASCRGPIVVERGRPACRVCGADGVCANCGGRSFGVERGGTERIAEWASRLAPVPVRGGGGEVGSGSDAPPPPGPGWLVVGTAAAVKDVGPLWLDLVAILDPDRALVRPGLHAGEQALATWMEAAAWAGPRSAGGRVLVQTRRPAHPAIQALVRWEPVPFLRAEALRRAEGGFPPNHPVFRIAGGGELEDALRAAGPVTLLAVPTAPDRTLCLVAVRPEGLPSFRRAVLQLVDRGVVTRVEAEPQL